MAVHSTTDSAAAVPAQLPGHAEGAVVPASIPSTHRVPLDQQPAAVYLATLAPSGRRGIRTALDQAAAALTGGQGDAFSVDWSQLRAQHVTAILRKMRDRGAAPATVNRMRSALRGVLRSAWRLGQLDAETLARAVDVPSVKARRLPAGRHVTAGEVSALFRVCAQDDPVGARDAALLAVLYGGGLRRSEAVSLQLDDYDQVTGTLTVTGKGGHQRHVYATNGGKDALDAWLTMRGSWEGALLAPVAKGGRVQRRALTAQAVLMRLRYLASLAGVQQFSPHDLRRSFVGELLDAGADVVAVQRLAGHANVSTTARYDRRGDRAARRAADMLHVPYQAPAA